MKFKRAGMAAVALSIAMVAGAHNARAADGGAGALESRIQKLEQRNRELEEQNQAIQGQLKEQKEAIDELVRQIRIASDEPTAKAQAQKVASVEKRQHSLPIEVGFRTGWSESPYSMPGGFFYGAFLNDRLLTQEDGVPYGFISGELMAGVVTGHSATTSANLATQLGLTGPASSWLNTVEIQPTVQYHLDPASLGLESIRSFNPYLLAGPAIWISLMSTPVVVKQSVPGQRFRHEDADIQPGAVYGLGFELSLSELQVPAIQGLLNHSFAGAEWRYNSLANGESFNQYTGSIAFGW